MLNVFPTYAMSQKKQDTTPLPITSPNVNRFSKSFDDRLGGKFATNWYLNIVPSVLWHCWLANRKGIRPVKKTKWWGAGMVICLERGADLHMAQLMQLPLTASCFIKIHIGFTFLVPAHLGSPGQTAVKRVYVYICMIFKYPTGPSICPSATFQPIVIYLNVSRTTMLHLFCRMTNHTHPFNRQITIPAPHHSVFYRLDALPAAQPTTSMHCMTNH